MQRPRCARVFLCSSAFVVVSSAAALAGDILVPRDHRTVEEALEAASPGDRVVVRGGTFENIHVKKGNVEIVARGTTVQGYVWIDASFVSVSGIRLGRNGRIVVTGDDVTVAGSKATGRGQRVISVQGGRRATIAGNKLAAGDIQVLLGSDATITGNRLKDGVINATDVGADIEANVSSAIRVTDAQASVLDNRCGWMRVEGDSCDIANNRVATFVSVDGDGVLVQGNDIVKGWVEVDGDDVLISGNTVVGGSIDVAGDRASILSNTVESSPLGVGVHGSDFTISGNDLTAEARLMHDGSVNGFGLCPGIGVAGSTASASVGGTITDNVVTHYNGAGITVNASEVTISGNDVHGIASNTSILISGTQNSIADNTIVQSSIGDGSGSGIDIRGDGNAVTGNDVGAVSQDAILVMSGTGNVIADNTVDAAPGCGLVVTCHASETIVSGCTVSGCGLGVVNSGTSTSLTDSTSQGNDFADILDLSDGFATFEDNSYSTLSHDRLLAPAVLTTTFD